MAIVAAMAVPHPPIILPEIGRGEEKKIAKTAARHRTSWGRVSTESMRPGYRIDSTHGNRRGTIKAT